MANSLRPFAFGFLGSLLILLSSCGRLGGGKLIGSGPLVENERMLLPFQHIEINSPVGLTVVQGETQSVRVFAQAEVQPRLKTSVKSNTLTIDLKADIDQKAGTHLIVTVPNLRSVEMGKNAGAVQLEGLSGKNLMIESMNSLATNLKDIRYETLEFDLEGSGDIMLSGQGEKLIVEVDGGADFDGYNYVAEKAEVESDGSGDIRVSATEQLKVEIWGSGNVYYRGQPKISLKDEGAGELKSDN